MKWAVVLAIEREVEIDASNINAVVDIANEKKSPEEHIVKIRLKR